MSHILAFIKPGITVAPLLCQIGGIMAREQEQQETPYSGVVVKLIGRPNRDLIINDADIHDLKIALYTTRSVDEFVKAV